MKKFLIGLMVLCTIIFISNVSFACDCGCQKAETVQETSCQKDCDCGCQKGEECSCDKTTQSCKKQKCCKKCACGWKKYFKKFKKCKKGCPLENIIEDNTDNEE